MQSKEVDRFADAVLTASRVLVALAARSLDEIADEVTLPQFRALVVLHSRGAQTLQGLAGELQVVPSTATRMCDRLVDKGLVSRTSPDNRREVQLEVTEAGRALVAAVSRRRRREIRRIVARMEPSSREPLVRALEGFADAAGEVPEQQWFLGWA